MPKTLLVAESCGLVAERLEMFFSRRGYRVEAVTDGVDCWNKLRESSPDVLILDADLVWGGGDGVLACMREDEHLVQTPVVLLTDAHSRDVDTSDPVVRWLRRPFDVGALHDAVETSMGTAVACFA